jgi:DNA-binding transcriptional LysR family regulator
MASKPHFEFQFLAHDRLVLVMPAKHPLARRQKVSVNDLYRYPLVLREVGSGLRHCLEESLERNGLSISGLNVKLELGSNEAIKDAVRRGIGVAVLSIYTVRRKINNGVRTATIEDLNCDRDIYVVRDRRRVLPAPGRTFLTYLEAHPPPASIS